MPTRDSTTTPPASRADARRTEPPSAAPPPRRGWRRLHLLTPRQRKVMGLLAIAELFDMYDAALVTIALKQIQQGLAIPEAQVSAVAGTIRLGMLFSFGVTLFADRFGRRRLLLVTLIGFSIFTFLSALARTAEEFVLAQLIARAFIGAEVMLASVVVIEELSARDRGWGLGVLGALGALGYGLAAFAFAFVDLLPGGWRALYVAGGAPLLVVAWMRRRLPETERFEAHRAARAARAERGGARETLRPLASLFAAYPGRLLAMCSFVVVFDFVHWPVFGLLAKSMQDVHGFSAGTVSAVVIAGGALGILGNLLAGVLGDRVGRRVVMFALLCLHGASAYAFYNGDRVAAVVAWIGITFAATGLGVLLKALGSELFPTSYRSTAAGVRLVVATLGGYLGYQAESWIYPHALAVLGDVENATQLAHALALTWMLPGLVLAAALIFFLPETAGRELEDISPERDEATG